MSNKTDTTSV
ncbi:hypothetical protein D043_1726A, partial [Vibrio parahaemolyticus EKP-021]